MYLCVRGQRSCICVKGIYFASFNHFDILFWNCSDSVVFLVIYLICTQPKKCVKFWKRGVKTRVLENDTKSRIVILLCETNLKYFYSDVEICCGKYTTTVDSQKNN